MYALLVKAMERSGLSAIARYVFHDRQQLGALRVRDGIVVLESMYFADEIRPTDGIVPKQRPRVDQRELEMAETLVERFTTSFDHGRYEDEHRKRLLAIVRRKQRGEEVHAAPKEEREAPPDLLEALRASVEAAREGKRRRKASPRPARRRKRTTSKR